MNKNLISAIVDLVVALLNTFWLYNILFLQPHNIWNGVAFTVYLFFVVVFYYWFFTGVRHIFGDEK